MPVLIYVFMNIDEYFACFEKSNIFTTEYYVVYIRNCEKKQSNGSLEHKHPGPDF